MDNLKLLEGEEVITEATNGLVVLTSKRIRLSKKIFGKEETVSIMLQNVSSVSMSYRSSPIILLTGVVATIVGIYLGQYEAGYLIYGFIVGLVFMAIYFLLRNHKIHIASNGGESISFHISDMPVTSIKEFIFKLENAISNNQ